NKVNDNIQPKPRFVLGLPTLVEIHRLLWNIRVPDQHELRKPDICPKDGETKYQFTQIMQMVLIDPSHIPCFLDKDQDHGNRTETAHPHRSKIVPAKHG